MTHVWMLILSTSTKALMVLSSCLILPNSGRYTAEMLILILVLCVIALMFLFGTRKTLGL